MKAAIVAILCVGFGCGGLALADLENGTYAPDIEAKDWINTDEPVSLAELRGMTVVLFFWVSWHEGGESMIELMVYLNSRGFGRTRGVYLLGVTDSDRKRVGEMLKKQKVFFPVALESKSHEEYKITAYPHIVIIDAAGKVAWSGAGGNGEPVQKAIMDVTAETPPTKTHPEEAAIAERSLREARRSLRENSLRDAFKAARDADVHALPGDSLKTRCQDMLELIESLGRDQLARAQTAVDQKTFDDAVVLLHDITRDFKGMEVARSAGKKLEALKKKYQEVSAILLRENESALAENMLQEAIDFLRATPRKIGEAYDKLEGIISDYPGTEAAAKAQTVLDRMSKSAGVMDYVRDHKASRECEMWLSQARAYELNGQPNRAKDLYRRIMDTHGDTIWADIAAKRLAQLP